MIIRAIADQHGNLPSIEPCDLLLIGGDICPVDDHRDHVQEYWLANDFRDWLDEIPAKHVVGVAGNHDWVFERRQDRHFQNMLDGLRWTYLQDTSVTVEGLKIYGTPWQPSFCNWAFNLPEKELAAKWDLIPDDTDILVLHGPPYGYGDHATAGITGRTGSRSLTNAIKRVKPKLAICGHIHEDRGSWQVGDTYVANVSLVDLFYDLVHDPVEFTL